ncbi:preprotein translocase subunit SecE [Mycolicibacterium neoaurum]|uniref:preprotein translocase subunit SecE n=1 Tax=Mycolicibacterium neoaurum TaxID=1795 RepID=UPI00248C134C|nr:preprotein translocase subunit SecE [Mycolicibacterium neoaurum]WBP96200.1 preprotein translocase subunit SecE [Mycolicibacterium neoaurum]WBS10269.1 preprotein translocase subunit SecE [Mycolicibacterium neoaurum]
MSDDKPALGPSADEAPEGGETAGQPAAAARPLRPTGKRTRRAAVGVIDDDADTTADTETVDASDAATDSEEKAAKRTKAPKAAKIEGSRVNPFVFVWNYLKQVITELRKVIWPNRKQMVTYTTVVLVFLAFMVTLIGLADLGLVRLVGIIFG